MPNQKHILLIDDDIKFSIGMVAILKREGYKVTNSRNGTEGLESIRTQKPDLILCDVMMPVPDGMEVKAEINKDEQLKNIPFMFISAKTSQTDKDRARLLGVTDYILKPFVVSEVLEKVNGILGQDESSFAA